MLSTMSVYLLSALALHNTAQHDTAQDIALDETSGTSSCQLVKTNKHMRVWVERFAQASQTLAA
jgi:hypothetical protein